MSNSAKCSSRRIAKCDTRTRVTASAARSAAGRPKDPHQLGSFDLGDHSLCFRAGDGAASQGHIVVDHGHYAERRADARKGIDYHAGSARGRAARPASRYRCCRAALASANAATSAGTGSRRSGPRVHRRQAIVSSGRGASPPLRRIRRSNAFRSASSRRSWESGD